MSITLLNEALKNLSNIPAKFPKVETIENNIEGETIHVYKLGEDLYLLISIYEDSYGTEVTSSIQICERTVPKSYNYKPI